MAVPMQMAQRGMPNINVGFGHNVPVNIPLDYAQLIQNLACVFLQSLLFLISPSLILV